MRRNIFYIHKKKYAGWGVTLLAFLYVFVSPLGVQGASSIAQGFQTSDSSVVSGMLVSAERDDPNSVVPSSLDNVDLLIGVVGEDSAIELSEGSSTVQVVNSGVVSTLVSNINGDVKAGDRITASPIQGVGMKAVESAITVGIAQEDLNDNKVTDRTIIDRNGNERTVKVGLVPVQIDTIFYAGQSNQPPSFVPSFLQDVANTVAGKEVSPARVVMASLLLLLLFVSIVALLYSATKSSIISIGRNPLSQRAVHKSLFEVGLTVIGILAFSVILIYLILTI